MSFLERGSRPLVLGHRGASADFPENTLRAFAGALEQGADGVELDVMCCGSGEVVVVHDEDLHRVSGGAPGSRLRVRSSPLAALRSFDLGGGQRIPTLAEVLEALPGGALVNVELKGPDTALGCGGERGGRAMAAALAQGTVEVLRRAHRLRGGATLVSSFDPLLLWAFRRASAAQVPLGFLFHQEQARPLRAGWPARLLRAQAVHPESVLCTERALRRWRGAGLFVHTWTVDEPPEVRRLLALGVDALICNRPAEVRRLLG